MFCRSLRSQSFCCQPLCESIRRLWARILGELLKSMESEFLVHVNEESRYIEGLHPFRSKHVVERLHEFLPIDNTRHFRYENGGQSGPCRYCFPIYPEFTLNKETFFCDAVESLWDEKDLFKLYFCNTGAFFRECDAVFPFQSGLRLTMQMPTAVFSFYRPKCAICCIRGISVCRWIRWTKCGKHFRIIRI